MGSKNSRLVVKITVLGLLLALLAYLFHPLAGHLSLTINGQPVANPLTRVAAVPLLIGILLLTGILAVLVILGVGVVLLSVAALLGTAALAFAAPYLWPILILVIVVAALLLATSRRKGI